MLSLIGLPALAANELYLAVASDMSYCMDELGAAFSKQVPQARLRVSVGASGNFYAQIKHGAPFDLFLWADMNYPSRLAEDGAADRASLAPYALGRLAIWSLDALRAHTGHAPICRPASDPDRDRQPGSGEAGMAPLEHGMIVTSKGRANWLAWTLGLPRRQTFWSILLPLSKHRVLTGVSLSLSRRWANSGWC